MKTLRGDPFRQKALTLAQADKCEKAAEPKCVCRCRGKAHGAARILQTANDLPRGRDDLRVQYTELPTSDPHRLLPEDEDKALTKLRARIRKDHKSWHYRREWNNEGRERIVTVKARVAPIVKLAYQVGWGEKAVTAAYEGPCPICLDDGVPATAD